MSETKAKPAKNFGDTLMTVGVVMLCLSIILPMVNVALTETTDLVLLLGGIGLAVVGVIARTVLRRKAAR